MNLWRSLGKRDKKMNSIAYRIAWERIPSLFFNTFQNGRPNRKRRNLDSPSAEYWNDQVSVFYPPKAKVTPSHRVGYATWQSSANAARSPIRRHNRPFQHHPCCPLCGPARHRPRSASEGRPSGTAWFPSLGFRAGLRYWLGCEHSLHCCPTSIGECRKACRHP